MPTILIADDNSNIQKMVSLALKGEGIDVVAVGNGEAAVRKLREICPDVVLADIFMPVRNGYEVCDFVKHDARLAHVPVILLTGAFDPFDEHEAQRVGADGVLKKPFVPPEPLVNLVKSLIARGGAEQLVGAVAGPKVAAGTIAQAPPPPPPPKPASTNADSSADSAQKTAQPVETFGEVVPAAQNSAAPVQESDEPADFYISERTTRVAFEELMAPTRDPEGTPKPNAGFGGFSAFPDLVDSDAVAQEPAATPGAGDEDDWSPTGDATAPEPESFWPPRKVASPPASDAADAGSVAAQNASVKVDSSPQVSNDSAASETPAADLEPIDVQAEPHVVPNYPWSSVAQESDQPEQNEAPSSYYSGESPAKSEPDPANGIEPGLVPTNRDGSGFSEMHPGDDDSSTEASVESSDTRPSSAPAAETAGFTDNPYAPPANSEPEPVTEEISARSSSSEDPRVSSEAPEGSAPSATGSSAVDADAINAIGREVKEIAQGETGLSQEEIVARVASRVIAKMQPQVLEMVTREVLKPIVEAMVRREVENS